MYQAARKYTTVTKCPCCGNDDETWAHIFQCPSDYSKEFREEHLDDVKEQFTQLKLPADVVTSIIDNVRRWLNKTTLMRDDTEQQELEEVLMEQDNIGWDNMLVGRISTRWRQLFEARYKPNGKGAIKWHEANLWPSKISDILSTFALDIWKHRNAKAHGTTREEKRKIRRRRAVRRVKTLYRNRPALRPTDSAKYFGTPLEEKLKCRAHQLEAWISHVRVAEKSFKDYGFNGKDGLKQQSIREWMAGSIEADPSSV